MKDKLQNFLARALYGRYGADELYNVLVITELCLLVSATVCNILGRIVPALAVVSIVLYALSFGLIVWAMFRFFSRNTPARRRENAAWLRFRAKFRRKPKPRLPADTADHVFRACPRCRSTLRLPRQAGKHTVKCPRCGERFTVKVK